MNEHYFSSTPSGDARHRTLDVELAGRSVQVQTAASIFSPDGLDRGTKVLFDVVPHPPSTGEFLDLGSGWGPIALTLGLLSPEARVTAVEVNERAAELTQANAARLGLHNIDVQHPEAIAADKGFDLIWSNPPIRIGKAALHELLSRWLPTLNPGGQAWLVVAKKLGADSLLPWITDMLEAKAPGQFVTARADSMKGFRVLRIDRH
ncbi:methyltransferase [Enteractinococcus fodinae]|uniref:class I SAM-dependent methyltransferase n=1 Tax=Enteractinococcus fodinae TaxID=684663 RepID=UPI00286C21C6|nr:methyltransferase [Enteractinococcus fodinae]